MLIVNGLHLNKIPHCLYPHHFDPQKNQHLIQISKWVDDQLHVL